MTVRLFAAAMLALPSLALASAQMPGREWVAAQPRIGSLRVIEAAATYRWDGPPAKSAEDPAERRTRVGFVRATPKDFAPPGWRAVEGGFVARFDVASAGAEGLRVRLDLDGAGAQEVRVRDSRGRVEAMRIPAGASEAWGPWTAGAVQAVEVFATRRPGPGALKLGAIVHFDRPLDAKAAGSCAIDTPCTTDDPVLDAAIAVRKKGMARITFVDGGRSFVCTGTLLDSERFPTPYFLTANHCVGRAEVAASIASFWFHEATGCATGTTSPGSRQVAGGMMIDFADPNTDHTLLVMNAEPPSGVTFSGWNAARLAVGATTVSLSHPAGDVAKWAQATVSGTHRFRDWEQATWLATFSRGIVEGGSSGSGLFTLADGSLQYRATLSATTTDGNGPLSCTNPGQRGVYNRFDVFYPQVARRLMASPSPVADDHGNRPAEATAIALSGAQATSVSGRIDYAGDVDVFRIAVPVAGTLVVRASGGTDTIGLLLDANGERITSNDDAQAGALDFGITRRVTAGTHFLAVSHWESAGSGPYSLALSLLGVTDNFTDLWWNPSESGWGINFNHQGQTLFATLFTYAADGAPEWFVMSNGARQPDGSFRGELYRASGPAFNAVPWIPVTLTQVGMMQVRFPSAQSATLTYTVGAVSVTRQIERQRFSRDTVCSWSVFDRSYAFNFQDLWWNPDEPGWGINFAHQGDTIFATLFTYRPDGRNTWWVMSDGARQPGSATYSGTLYRTSGPPFDASPWAAVAVEPAGTMRVAFTGGNLGTLTFVIDGVTVTKTIQRQVFASPATECESAND